MKITGPFITEYQIKDFNSIISGINTTQTHKAYYRRVIVSVLDSLRLPIPSENFLKYASKNTLSLVLHGLSRYLIESQYATEAHSKAISDGLKAKDLGGYSYGGNSYRLRTFGIAGTYPNSDFERAEAKYRIINGRPLLLTKNHSAAEERSIGGGSENTVLSRREVKLISSFMCVNGLIVHFSLEDDMRNSKVLDIPSGYLSEITEKDLFPFIIEYAVITGSNQFNGVEAFDFAPSIREEAKIGKFYRRFKISDLLLLRTCFLLVKASSMVENRNYFEDAISNIFVALEGVMMIMQRNAGEDYENIKRTFQKPKYDEIFADNNQTYDFVFEEVFARGEKRAILVHPQAGTDWGWVPPIYGEDYYDYRQILRCLIYYVVTGDKYDPFEYR